MQTYFRKGDENVQIPFQIATTILVIQKSYLQIVGVWIEVSGQDKMMSWKPAEL